MNALERQQKYWSTQLADLPPLPKLPCDKEAPPASSYVRESVTAKLDPELWRDAKSLGAREDTTPQVVLLAALDTLLFRYTNQTDLVVGAVLDKKSRPPRNDIIAVRTRLAGHIAARDLIGIPAQGS